MLSPTILAAFATTRPRTVALAAAGNPTARAILIRLYGAFADKR